MRPATSSLRCFIPPPPDTVVVFLLQTGVNPINYVENDDFNSRWSCKPELGGTGAKCSVTLDVGAVYQLKELRLGERPQELDDPPGTDCPFMSNLVGTVLRACYMNIHCRLHGGGVNTLRAGNSKIKLF